MLLVSSQGVDLQLVEVDLGVLAVRLGGVVLRVLPFPLRPQALNDVLVEIANVNVTGLKETEKKFESQSSHCFVT